MNLYRHVLLLVIILLIMGGCSAEPRTMTGQSAETIKSDSLNEAEFIEVASPIDLEQKDELVLLENSLNFYAEKYTTEYCFEDVYIPYKYWLIGDDYVVQVLSFIDSENVIVVNRNSIDRVECKIFTDYASVTVFDRTNQTISIMVYMSDFDTITKNL